MQTLAVYVEENIGIAGRDRVFLSVKYPLRDLAGKVYAVGGRKPVLPNAFTERVRKALEDAGLLGSKAVTSGRTGIAFPRHVEASRATERLPTRPLGSSGVRVSSSGW